MMMMDHPMQDDCCYGLIIERLWGSSNGNPNTHIDNNHHAMMMIGAIQHTQLSVWEFGLQSFSSHPSTQTLLFLMMRMTRRRASCLIFHLQMDLV